MRTGSALIGELEGLKNQMYAELGSESGRLATTAPSSVIGKLPGGTDPVR